MGCGCGIEMPVEEKETERKVFVHLPTDGDMNDYELGDEVTIVIKGKIQSGRFSLKKEEWDDAKGHLEVSVSSIEIEGKNVFESLFDD